MDTQRFTIELTKSEIELLRMVAEQERRPPRDQAAYMLSQTLKQQCVFPTTNVATSSTDSQPTEQS